LRLIAPDFNFETSSEESTLTEAGYGYGGNLAVIKARAVHAGDIWENVCVFDSFEKAIKDCTLVIGTTRRRGRRRKRVTMTPAELGVFLKDRSGKTALVFGNERTGLEDDELDLCGLASHIPADDNFPSLNLSHAVMVYAYELYKSLTAVEKTTVKGQWMPMDQETINIQVKKLTDRLKNLGFYKKPGREEQERFYRDVFSRAGLTENEAVYLIDNIAKAARLGVL